ncbi:MAG TPA: type II toxin-antitoxin system RelE/ParE family toxin [Pararhizobium sp.]|uniref:type II toxin-antitoxin system RelE/ParE family toxin n=1 Tax=Pararhizobium sp. TaxID=1977563 RepID=UPI002CA913DB|nr:type II toxin-antitoxin system RelE/ParE family toxin [Pararhizobium sp.]HTO33008.1 type II toxin-antitoxin system RelE/ParE family toxin [Pararhizobium sp.]
MSYSLRFSKQALDDLDRHYDYLLAFDNEIADRATTAIRKALAALLDFPFSARKADADNPFLRELVIPFGSSGYVALFEIEDAETITILAVRHQREDDYH